MKGRKQKISQDTCLRKGRAEPKGYAGGQTFMWITENNLIAQILIPLYEPQFSKKSYGFRPKRNAHQALNKCITEGYGYAVDLIILCKEQTKSRACNEIDYLIHR